MCGRYLFTEAEDNGDLQQILARIEQHHPGEFRGGEVFPGTAAPVLVAEGERLRAELFLWGLPQPASRDGLLINARSETAETKPAFRDSFAHRRCLVPATGYFEWKDLGGRKKEKYLFTLPDAPVVYLAGLWAPCGEENHYVILTAAANASARAVHERMPVLVPRSQLLQWVNSDAFARRLLASAMPPVVCVKAG